MGFLRTKIERKNASKRSLQVKIVAPLKTLKYNKTKRDENGRISAKQTK